VRVKVHSKALGGLRLALRLAASRSSKGEPFQRAARLQTRLEVDKACAHPGRAVCAMPSSLSALS
jgi:hypothetical protein